MFRGHIHVGINREQCLWVSTWPCLEPEVALVVVNTFSLAVSDFVSLPLGDAGIESGRTIKWEKSQTRQPKSPPTLHYSSAGWAVTVVSQLDLAGGQSIIRQLVLTVESIWGCGRHRLVRFLIERCIKWNELILALPAPWCNTKDTDLY